MGDLESRNYVTVDSVDGKVDSFKVDEKKLINDAREIAEKINSWDRPYFQNKIFENIKSLNKNFQAEKDLLKNEEQADKIIFRLSKDINTAINKYIDSMNSFDLGMELDEISNKGTKDTQELIQGIRVIAAKNKAKQELKLSNTERMLIDIEGGNTKDYVSSNYFGIN